MRTIAELLNKHAGEEAWIIGKGPTLEGFDFGQSGHLRICINESLLIVPEPSFFFAHDELPIQRVAACWPDTCQAILEPARGAYAIRNGIPPDSVFTYDKRDRELDALDWTSEIIALKGSLLGFTGTAHSAIHFCRLIGASSIAFVGMDGGGGYARSLGLTLPLGGGQHDMIRRDSINVAKRLGLPHRFAS